MIIKRKKNCGTGWGRDQFVRVYLVKKLLKKLKRTIKKMSTRIRNSINYLESFSYITSHLSFCKVINLNFYNISL